MKHITIGVPSKIMNIPVLKNEKESAFYMVTVDGEKARVYEHYVSAAPINRRWPGHQREISQREKSYFVRFENEKAVTVEIKSEKTGKPIVRPISSRVSVDITENGYRFTLTEHGAYSFELGDAHQNLHLFFDKPKTYEFSSREKVIAFRHGTFDVGEIVLRSDETLFVDEDAVVYCNIVAENAENVRICGRGILDNSKSKEKILFDVETGDGQKDVMNAERKHFVSIRNCRNVTIDGPILRDSLCYNVSAVNVDGFVCENIKIIGCWRYNSDGVDMQNCRNTRVSDCFIRTYDDCVCVKGDGNVRTNCEHTLIENCVFWCDWGHAMEIGLETCADKITDIRYRRCKVIRTNFDFLHIGCADYAKISDVAYEDIDLEFAGDEHAPQYQEKDGETYLPGDEPYFPTLIGLGIFRHFEYSVGNEYGHIENVVYRNIRVHNAPDLPVIEISGANEEHKIKNVTFENVTLDGRKATSLSDFKTGIKYGENILIK